VILYIFDDFSPQKMSEYEKKSGFTFVEQAIVLVPEFKMVVHKLEQQVTLRYLQPHGETESGNQVSILVIVRCVKRVR
jgi:hypothetical protein